MEQRIARNIERKLCRHSSEKSNDLPERLVPAGIPPSPSKRSHRNIMRNKSADSVTMNEMRNSVQGNAEVTDDGRNEDSPTKTRQVNRSKTGPSSPRSRASRSLRQHRTIGKEASISQLEVFENKTPSRRRSSESINETSRKDLDESSILPQSPRRLMRNSKGRELLSDVSQLNESFTSETPNRRRRVKVYKVVVDADGNISSKVPVTPSGSPRRRLLQQIHGTQTPTRRGSAIPSMPFSDSSPITKREQRSGSGSCNSFNNSLQSSNGDDLNENEPEYDSAFNDPAFSTSLSKMNNSFANQWPESVTTSKISPRRASVDNTFCKPSPSNNNGKSQPQSFQYLVNEGMVDPSTRSDNKPKAVKEGTTRRRSIHLGEIKSSYDDFSPTKKSVAKTSAQNEALRQLQANMDHAIPIMPRLSPNKKASSSSKKKSDGFTWSTGYAPAMEHD